MKIGEDNKFALVFYVNVNKCQKTARKKEKKGVLSGRTETPGCVYIEMGPKTLKILNRNRKKH